jgi:hypothetical protein
MDARPAQGHEMPATESFPEWRERADPKRPLRELRVRQSHEADGGDGVANQPVKTYGKRPVDRRP